MSTQTSLSLWRDRKEIKNNIANWLRSDNSDYLISIIDSQEIEDFTSWIQNYYKANYTGIAYLDSDTEISKYSLLRNLADDIGEVKFSKLNTYIKISSSFETSVIINQIMGEDMSSENNITFRENQQNININTLDRTTILLSNFEKNINHCLDLFIEGLNSVSQIKSVLLVCRFRGKYNEISSDFRNWFQYDFLKKIKRVKNAKVCILCEGELGQLTTLVKYAYQSKVDKLSFEDIFEETKNIIEQSEGFCNGVVDADTRQVSYTEYKMKLHAAMKNMQRL